VPSFAIELCRKLGRLPTGAGGPWLQYSTWGPPPLGVVVGVGRVVKWVLPPSPPRGGRLSAPTFPSKLPTYSIAYTTLVSDSSVERKERGHYYICYTYVTVFIRNAANLTHLLIKVPTF
jgi:hypothetical protein